MVLAVLLLVAPGHVVYAIGRDPTAAVAAPWILPGITPLIALVILRQLF